MDIFKTLILDTPDSLDNISGVLPVVNGGTGADNAPDARVNLLPNYTGNANKVLSLNGGATDVEWTSNGAGDVAGPASSTDNAVARFDSTTGKVIQNSGVTISDANLLTADALSINNNTTLGSSNSDTVTFNARAASEFTPATDNTYDLGRTGHEWRDLYIDGTANIDSLVADTADINGGTIDGTTVGATTASTGAFTTLSASTDVNAGGNNLSLTNTNAGSSAQATIRFINDTAEQGNISLNSSIYSFGTLVANAIGIRSYTAAGVYLTAENASGHIRLGIGATPSTIADFSSTGLAVTGALSSTTGANFATSSGAVGVGTASPSGKLQVVANTASAGLEDGFSVSNAIDSNCFLQCSGSAATDKRAVIGPSTGTALAFQTGASERLRIDSTGNVGIGTTSVSNKLQSAYTVSASVPAAGATGHGLGVGSSGFGLAAGALNSGNAYLQATRWDGTAANYDLILQPNGGNVGIGTTAPADTLSVNGGLSVVRTGAVNNININDASGNLGATISFLGSQTGTGKNWQVGNQIQASDTLTFTPSTATGGSTFTTPTLTLTGSGNVGIGTTGPSYQLELSTDSAAKPSTNTWTIASDARIKTETGEYTKGLDAVLALRPVTYRYNGKAGMIDDGEDKISIIAQEAINAFPECVGSYMTKLNEDDEEETEVLNWNGHALTFALVNSIKELAARLEALENN
jgi:trimeric autotransporter adhesin